MAANHPSPSRLITLLLRQTIAFPPRVPAMTIPLPKLDEHHIVIDVDAGTATALLVFPDNTEIPIHIGWETLREWAISSKAFEIKATIIEHYGYLASLAMQARALNETFLTLM
jgi:hypothetical protein